MQAFALKYICRIVKIYFKADLRTTTTKVSIMLKKLFARQFRRPSGPLGHFAARFMEKNNQDYFAHACDLLDVQNDDAILEIGCGAGYAIEMILKKNGRCSVDAIDFSPFMLKKAAKRNQSEVGEGRIRFFKGDFGDFDFGKSVYSKIFAINVIYFWNDLDAQFSKIFTLLKKEGRVVLFMSSPERLKNISFAVDEVFNKHTIDQVETALSKAGFKKVDHQTVVKMGFDTFYVIAEK